MQDSFLYKYRHRIAYMLCAFAFMLMLLYTMVAHAGAPSWVNDDAHLLTPQEVTQLNNQLIDEFRQTGVAIVVLTTPDMGGQDIETFSINHARDWGVGQKDKDNGVLIVAAMAERKLRIEVGYGLESQLTDAKSKGLITNYLGPNFHNKAYFAGLSTTAKAIGDIVKPVPAEPAPAASSADGPHPFFWLVIVGLAVLILSVVAIMTSIEMRASRKAEEDEARMNADAAHAARQYSNLAYPAAGKQPKKKEKDDDDSGLATGVAAAVLAEEVSRSSHHSSDDDDSSSRSSSSSFDTGSSFDSGGFGGGSFGGGGASGDF